ARTGRYPSIRLGYLLPSSPAYALRRAPYRAIRRRTCGRRPTPARRRCNGRGPYTVYRTLPPSTQQPLDHRLLTMIEAARRCGRSPRDARAVMPAPQSLALLLHLLDLLLDVLHNLVDREARWWLAGRIRDERFEEGRRPHHGVRDEVKILGPPLVV